MPTIQYRYLDTSDLWEQANLKAMVVDILRRVPAGGQEAPIQKAKLRRIDLDQDGSVVVLNQVSSPASWSGPIFAGQLLHLKPGTEIPGITEDLEAEVETYDIQSLTLGERTQLVNGILYFAITGNHIGLIEDNKARGRTLERYLTAFLQRAGELEEGQLIILNSKIKGEVRKVEKLEIIPNRTPKERSQPTKSDGAQTKSITDAESAGADVFELLRVVGWTEHDLLRLQESLPEDGWLEGKLNVLFKQKGRKAAAVERTELERAIRNLGPLSVSIAGGGKEKAGLRTLTEAVHVERTNGLLNPDSAMQEIVACLKSWSLAGQIDCNFGDE